MKRFFRSAIITMVVSAAALAGSCGDTSIKYYNLGIDAAERGDLEEAVADWQKALQYRPDDADTRFNLGIALIEMKRYEEAEIHLSRATELSPQDADIQYALGKAYEMQDKLSEAKKAYTLSTMLKPNLLEPYVGLASCTLKQKQYPSAQNYATRALSISPRDLKANLILSEAFYEQGNYQEAYAQLLSAKSINSRDPRLLLLLGKVMSARHMHEDAIAALQAARESGASDSELFVFLGRSYLALKDYTNAEKQFRLAIYKDKNNPAAWTGLAESCMNFGKNEDSLEAWDRAASIDPDDPEIPLGKSLTLIKQKRFEEAAVILEKLRARSDTPSRALYYLGHSLMRLGRKEEARSAFEEFIKTWQGDPAMIEEVKELLITL